jgi:hypothetical protein
VCAPCPEGTTGSQGECECDNGTCEACQVQASGNNTVGGGGNPHQFDNYGGGGAASFGTR